MNKFKLLSATALTVAVIASANPAFASGENQGWFASMKQSVSSWFSDDEDQANVAAGGSTEAYLDEVTIAVPPMTADDAASIQPAAGDLESEGTVEGQQSYAPGSRQYNNTELNGTVTGNTMADINPAAGDAEEVNDEAIIVAEESDADVNADEDSSIEVTSDVDGDMNADTSTDADVNADTTVNGGLNTESDMDAQTETDANVDTDADAAVDTMNDADVQVETNEGSTTGLGVGDVGLDASTDSRVNVGVE